MPIDASIPLANIGTPNQYAQQGLSLQNMAQGLALHRYQLQQAKEDQAKRRMMLDVYRGQNTFDQDGLISMDAIKQLYQIDPSAGESAMKFRSGVESKREQMNKWRTEEGEKRKLFGQEMYKLFVTSAEEALNGGAAPEIAEQKARETVLGEARRRRASGTLPWMTDADEERFGKNVPTLFEARAAVNSMESAKDIKGEADLAQLARDRKNKDRDMVQTVGMPKEGTENISLADVGKPPEQGSREAVNEQTDPTSGAVTRGINEPDIQARDADSPEPVEVKEAADLYDFNEKRVTPEETQKTQLQRAQDLEDEWRPLLGSPSAAVRKTAEQNIKEAERIRKGIVAEGKQDVAMQRLALEKKRVEMAKEKIDHAFKQDASIDLTDEGAAVAASRRLYFGETPRGYGKASTALRIKIDNMAAHMGRSLGLSPEEQAILPKDNGVKMKAVDKLTTWAATVGRSSEKLERDTDVAIAYSEKMDPSKLRRIATILGESQTAEAAANAISKEFNDPIANAYGLALNSVRTEYARMMSGPTSNAMLPVEAMKKGNELVSKGVSTASLRELKRVMMMDANNTMAATKNGIEHLRNSILSGGKEEAFSSRNIPASGVKEKKPATSYGPAKPYDDAEKERRYQEWKARQK